MADLCASDARPARAAGARVLTLVVGVVCSLTWAASAATVAIAAEVSDLQVAAGQPALTAASDAQAATATVDMVALSQSCAPTTVRRLDTTECEVTAVNNSFEDVVLDFATTTSKNLLIVATDGATLVDARLAQLPDVSLAGASPGVPDVAPGATPAGYLPLDLFGIVPTPIGDEQILTFSVPAFEYAGQTWTSIGVDSNGYIIVGGGTTHDNKCCDLPDGPDPARPNNILAPFWTDLDGTGAPGVFLATLTDGVSTWIVVEWRVNVFGTASSRVFQTWIGINGSEDITYTYDAANPPTDPGQDFLVGAENALGQGDMDDVLPTEDLRVTSSAPTAGGSVTYEVTIRGQQEGTGTVTTNASGLSAPLSATTQVQVLPKKP